MTEIEKTEIINAVIDALNDNSTNYDDKVVEPYADDIVLIMRKDGDERVGKCVTWEGLCETITASAKNYAEASGQSATTAEEAKNAANTILTQVQSKGTEITNFVATSKAEIETQKDESVEEVRGVYIEDLNELKGDLGDVEDRINPIDFRQKSTGEVILDVDVTGTMEAFMDGMEQEPNEAIALTLEPDVPTAESHNFGVRGQICIDSNYLYVCTALNTWKKISLLDL